MLHKQLGNDFAAGSKTDAAVKSSSNPSFLALPNDEAKKQALLQFQASFHLAAQTASRYTDATNTSHSITGQPNTDPVQDPGPTTPCTPFPPEARVSNISEYMSPPSSFKAMLEQHHASATPTRSNRSPTSSPPGNTTSVDFVVATGDEAHDMASVSGGPTTTVPMNVDVGDLVDQVTDELQALQSGAPSTQGEEYTTVIAKKSKKKAKKKGNPYRLHLYHHLVPTRLSSMRTAGLLLLFVISLFE